MNTLQFCGVTLTSKKEQETEICQRVTNQVE